MPGFDWWRGLASAVVTFSDEPLDWAVPDPPTDNGDDPTPTAADRDEWSLGDAVDSGLDPAFEPPAPAPAGPHTVPADSPSPAAGPAPDVPGVFGAEDRERRELPRVIAVANQKGGVGKTTSTINIGACLAELGQRTLIIDLDPQGNASTGLGIENRGLETSMYHVLMHDVPLEDCIEPTDVKHLFVAPASLDLAGAEIELVPAFSRETRLRRAIDAVIDAYDYVLIDCPPSLGLLTVNGLSAAREVLVPIQCEYYALEGLGQLLRNVDLVRRNLNPSLHVSTIVCVMYDGRTKLADQVVSEVREHFGDKVVRTIVPRSVRLSEAPSFGQPIITFDPRSRGAVAYRDVAKEVHSVSAQRVG
jgi:chromosome partitioning protein